MHVWSENIVTQKAELRRQLLARRRAEADREGRSLRIAARLLALESYAAAGTVMCYVDLADEVRTRDLFARYWGDGKRVAVPYLHERRIELFRLESLDELLPGHFGVLEPSAESRRDAARRLDPAAVDLVVAPGVGFDRRGGRLGYGKGYYDAFLKRVRPETAVVALAFACQFVEQIPRLAHDVPMDRIVTEDEVVVGIGRQSL